MPRISSPVHQPSDVTDNRVQMTFELVNARERSNTTVSGGGLPNMVLHMNPTSIDESYAKLITRQFTRGGQVEFHWGEELDSFSCSLSTGMFLTTSNGISVLNRKASIAYQKYIELISIYRNNALIYDSKGNIIFTGSIRMHFDGSIFKGYFESLVITENSENSFTFEVAFEFKVEHQTRSVGL